MGKINGFNIGYSEGEQHHQPKFSMFVSYLKIIKTFLKNDISILKQILWETKK